jgi:AcrR family transcriptional regulator
VNTSSDVREHGRDRRKRITRQALRRSVLELGLEHDLASVSVEAIAERAEVSARTFFNYFESKEDAALLDLFQMDDTILATLSQGPVGSTWQDVTELFADDLDRAVEDEDFSRFLQLQDMNPGLAGRQLAAFARFETRISAALVVRLGGDADAQVRAPLLVGSCFTAVRVALNGWAKDGRQGPVRPYLERALSVVEPAFSSN